MDPLRTHMPPAPMLHVGYHKTGTTFLQKQFFSQHPGIGYLGKPWANKAVAEFFTAFNFTNALDYDIEESRAHFAHLIATLQDREAEGRSQSSVRAIVVGQESLHSGPEWFGVSVVAMVERLREVFPEAKILITIRNQVDYLDSFYRNYV